MKRVFIVAMCFLSLQSVATEMKVRFRIDGSTVVDEQTGLRWKRCSVGQSFLPNGTCLGTAKKFDFYQAQKLTNYSPQKDGFWRVPTKNELATLVDTAKKGMKTDSSIFSDVTEKNSSFWTCDMYVDGAAWYVDFSEGYVGYMAGDHSSANDRLAVRLVHVER